jgi:hypothetical protein
MKSQLTTWERLAISWLIGRLQGDAALIHKAMKVFDAVDLTDEEKREINLRQVGENALVWDDPAREWDVSIKDPEAANLVLVTVRNNRSWLDAKAREVAGLFEAQGLP